jgi:hypothetical protein
VKTVNIDQMNLETCVREAQQGGLLVMRNGEPAALVFGIEGMDQEQIELGLSDRFWTLVARRRQEASISRTELEERMSGRYPS